MFSQITTSSVAASEFVARLGERAATPRAKAAATRLYAMKAAAVRRGGFDPSVVLCEAAAMSRTKPALGYIGLAAMTVIFGTGYATTLPLLATAFGLH